MREIKFRVWDTMLGEFKERSILAIALDGTLLQGGLRVTSPDRFSIQQFTGLKDKNGREVYEGDIVKHSNGYSITHIEDIHDFCGDGGIYGDFAKDVEIIGNIYENSELLNEKED